MEEQERKEVWVMNKKTVMMQLFWGLAMVVLLVGCLWFLVLHTVRASSDPLRGCNSNGQVFDLVSHITVHPVLYVSAEHVSKNLVQDALKYKMRGGLASVHKIANQEDGFVISCRQWKCHHILPQPKENEQLNPVLLMDTPPRVTGSQRRETT
ncbi:hypothetical protein ACFX13_014180 [Malus domestica]